MEADPLTEEEMAALVLPQTVGDRMWLALRHRGWDMIELAARTGIPDSSLSRYLRDETEVPRARLQAIANTLGVTPDYLLGYRPRGSTHAGVVQSEPVAA
jgi:transcriptional regulator with XRE-family HTH domain